MKEASESQDQIIQGHQSLSHLIISSIAPYHVYLVLILILSLMLQYQKLGWGLVTDSADFFGLSAFHIAESTLVKIPVAILENNDWNPHFFDEPSLFYNTMAVTFFSIKSLFGSLSLVQYVKIARILTILFTLVTITGTFFIAKEIWDTETGLFSALFMAINPYYLWFSSIAKEDPMTVMFVTIAFVFFMKYLNNPKYRNGHYFMLTMLFAGLANSTKYPAGLTLLFFPTIFVLYEISKNSQLTEIIRAILKSMAVYTIAFIVGTPFSIFATREFLQGVFGEFTHYTTSHPGFLHYTWTVHIKTLTGLWDTTNIWGKNGLGLLLLLVISGFLLIMLELMRRNVALDDTGYSNHTQSAGAHISKNIDKKYPVLAIISWMILVFFIFGFVFKVKMGNQMMMLMPQAMVCAGYAATSIKRGFTQAPPIKRYTISLLLVLVICLTLTYAISGNIALNNDNRYYAAQWLDVNIPHDARIGATLFTYIPDNFTNMSILTLALQYPPGDGADNDDDNSNSNINSIMSPDDSERFDYDIVILSSNEYQRFLEAPLMYPAEAEMYTSIMSNNTEYELVQRFTRSETQRQRSLNFGIRAIMDNMHNNYRGEADVLIFKHRTYGAYT